MASHHARSNSFPSWQHPLVAEFDEQLRRLRSSQEASSSDSVASKLSRLQDLHDCADQLLSQPRNIQSLCKDENQERVGEILDGSLRILDMCSVSSDAFSQMKESVQEIQSILRRRRGDESGLITSAVKKFLASRKTIQKVMKKGFKVNHPTNKEEESDEMIELLGEIESITLAVLESMFSFISGPKSQKSLVSKLMNSKRVVCEEVNEFETGVAALQSLITRESKTKTSEIELQKLEKCIEDLEDAVESLTRRLIKSRVSLLNVFSH